MKRFCGIVLAFVLASALSAHAFLVFCNGTMEGGSGGLPGTDYAYMVILTGPTDQFDFFEIGMDQSIAEVQDFVVMDSVGNVVSGWSGTGADNTPGYRTSGTFTDHGNSARPVGAADNMVSFTGPTLDSSTDFMYWFGFNSREVDAPEVTPANDFGWGAGSDTTYYGVNWNLPVGSGSGPVHAPVPEPTTILLFGIGACVVGLRRRLRR